MNSRKWKINFMRLLVYRIKFCYSGEPELCFQFAGGERDIHSVET